MACKYVLTVGDTVKEFNDKAALAKYIRENQLYKSIEETKKVPSMTTDSLAASLRQAKFGEQVYSPSEYVKFQIALLGSFTKLEDQSSYFYKAGKAIALTKGLGKSFDQIDGMKRSLNELGLNEYGGEMTTDIPFDVRYLLTGNPDYTTGNSDQYSHEITANNLRIANEIDVMSRVMFMERTPDFTYHADRVISNMKNGLPVEKTNEIKDQLASFAQIAAYKRWLNQNDRDSSTLRNSLIYDTSDTEPTIVDIVKEAIELAPTNTFLSFINPVPTTVKVGKRKTIKNISNKDLLNTIEGKTRGRLEPDMVASMMDSFTDLYNNPKTKFHAKALFDYLIVKDGLMFKNKSFIRMLPTALFNDMSDATRIATKLMSANSMKEYKSLLKELGNMPLTDQNGNDLPYFTENDKKNFNQAVRDADLARVRNGLYLKVFGLNYNGFYDTFENIYATDVNNSFNLALARPKVGKKIAKGITYGFDKEQNKTFLHVSLFPKEYQELPKDSDERTKWLKDALDELDQAGFPKSDSTVPTTAQVKGKIYLDFKKYVRVYGQNTGYKTFKLVQVKRDKQTLDSNFTADGQYVPHGHTAVYESVDNLGASNTVGMANLGKRMTPAELQKRVAAKTKQPEVAPTVADATPVIDNTQGAPVTTEAPTTLGSFGGISFSAADMNEDMYNIMPDVTDEDREDDNCINTGS